MLAHQEKWISGRLLTLIVWVAMPLFSFNAHSSDAAVTVSGNNSANPTSTNADPIIGVEDLGRLTITGGDVVTSDMAIVGGEPTGIGLVTVTDFNPNTTFASRWNTGSLTVGEEGTGRLEILDGAVVNVDFATNPGAGDFIIGNELDSLGTVIVRGLGTMLRLGDESFIGDLGTGVLIIEDEGLVIGTNDAAQGTDVFTVGLRGRVELNNGRLRTESFTNNGAIIGHGRIDSENLITSSTSGRIETNSGDRLVVNAPVDNDGEVTIVGGEIEFFEQFVNSNQAAKVTLLGGVVRFPETGFGFDSTSGVLATTGSTNDIYGTVRIQGASSRIVVGGESTAVFHDPVTNSGSTIQVFPGSTPIFLQGLTTTGAGAVLAVQLADPTSDPDSGQIEVVGSAVLDGALQLDLTSGFVPNAGDTFQILTAAGGVSGSLDLAAAPALTGGMRWDLDITQNAVVVSVVATGDYNSNGIVDAADYVVWRNLAGQSGAGLAADGNGSGVVDSADYEIWRSNFGRLVGSEASIATTSIPEPAAVTLLCIAGGVSSLGRKRKLHL
jgi:T5SS/PEP-CTERM-associated repeat protein